MPRKRTTRELVLAISFAPPGREARQWRRAVRRLSSLPLRRRSASLPGGGRRSPAKQQNPGANRAKEPERRERARARHLAKRTKRLSATDISALASMKNVAKCDTWCELQNPANHRVFERKLRPKPLG
ncbi:hypothetical protein LOK49_LG14G01662 [Camellia lanceoleosa]|uniref:Uncharacterized protein n=1 Tax=Camellia lanceoleosa TaxID=1840588 RepID=A0ACC0F9Q9_9ERIC|nr:hypothetical protein LOK49_LG14G01662 [Camellia lanceoleosa]